MIASPVIVSVDTRGGVAQQDVPARKAVSARVAGITGGVLVPDEKVGRNDRASGPAREGRE